MNSITYRVERISDRILDWMAPKADADAACNVYARCCVTMGARVVEGRRLYDPLHDTGCGRCVTNGRDC